MRSRNRGESEFTVLNNSKSVRAQESLTGMPERPSSINICRQMAVTERRGTLATSDNRDKVYPQLRNRRATGETNLKLIVGNYVTPLPTTNVEMPNIKRRAPDADT